MSTPPAPEWFAAALEALRRGDTAAFVAMYEDDAVHEMPLAPPGRPRELVGKAAIAEYTATLPTVARFDLFHDVRAHESDNELIVEFAGTGIRVASGAPLQLAYVWFITHTNGRVTRIRDYTMPQA